MKKYSSIKAVRPIVFVAILVMLTILFALYSTSINPIAEDVFTALDLDDTPLADVATDVKQAEAGSMTVSGQANNGKAWNYSNFSKKREQSSISELDVSNGTYSINQSTNSNTEFTIASHNWQNTSGETTGTNPAWQAKVGSSAAFRGDIKVIFVYDFYLSTPMYRAILSGQFKPQLSNIQLSWTITNGSLTQSPGGNLTPWSYIGIGYEETEGDKFTKYQEMWHSKNDGDAATATKYTNKRTDYNGTVDISAPSALQITGDPASGKSSTARKILRIAIGVHVYGEPTAGSRNPIIKINSISSKLSLSAAGDSSNPSISLSTGENTTSPTVTATFSDGYSALKNFVLTRDKGQNGALATPETVDSYDWTSDVPTTNNPSNVRSISKPLSLSNGYGEYTLTVYDITGNKSTKKIYYFDPKISLAIKTDGAVNTSGGYVTIDAYANGSWTTTSASSNGTTAFPEEFTVWAIVKPGYYFKGFSHDGAFNSNFNVDMQSSGTTGTYTYKNQYKNASGGTVDKPGVFGFNFKVSNAVLAKYPASGTITLYAEFGTIKPSGVTNNQTFTYAGSGSNAIKPTIDVSQHLTVAGTAATAAITIKGTYKDGTEVAPNTDSVKFAGNFTATFALNWNGTPLGSTSIAFAINPVNITIAPVFGTKTVVTKVYNGTAEVSATPNWVTTVGKNFDPSALTFGLKEGKSLAYKYVALGTYGDQNFNSITPYKDCSGALSIVAIVTSNADVQNYIGAQSTNKPLVASYVITYDAQAYYTENNSSFSKTVATGAITKKDLVITFKMSDEGTKMYDGTTDVTTNVSASIAGVISGEGIGVSYSASIEDKKVENNKQVTVSNITLTTSNATTAPITNYNVSGYIYLDANDKDVTSDLKQFLINITRAPMTVVVDNITGTDKIYDNTTVFNGNFTYSYTPGDGIDKSKEVFNDVAVIEKTAVYDDVNVGDAVDIIITISFDWDDFVNYYWIGDAGALTGNDGFVATFTAKGKIEKRNIALTIGNASKYYGTEDPNLYGLVSAVAANESAGLYAPVHKVTDIVAAVNRANGEDAYNDEGNQIQYPISLTLNKDAFISNYNIAVTNGTFTINKTAVKFGFNITSQTVTYGYGNEHGKEAIIDEINNFNCMTYTYAPAIGNNFKITDKETNVPKLGLEDNTDWSHYMAGTYSYGGSDRAITIENVTHKNFIFELDTTKISDFTIEKKTLGLKVKPHSNEYTGASIYPTTSSDTFELTQGDIAVGDSDALQSAVKVLYVSDELNANGPSACGTYDITAILTNDLLNNNYTLNVSNDQFNILVRMLTVEVLGFDKDGKKDMVYSGSEPTLYYNIDNYIEKHKDDVYANVEVSFTKINELGIVWPNAGEYTVILQAIIVDNSNEILDNYTIEPAAVETLIIRKATLTVTYESETVEYGETPKGALIYDGFENGETEAVLTKQPTVKYHRLAVEDPDNEGSYIPYPDRLANYEHINNYNGYINVGIWSFVASGGEAANYNFKYIPGNLTVTKATLNVEYNDLSLTYGDIYVEGLATSSNPYLITVNNAQNYFTITGYHVGGFVPSTLTDEYKNQPDGYENVFGNEDVGYFIAHPYDKAGDNYQVGVHEITKDYFEFNFKNYDVDYKSGYLTVSRANLKLSIKIPQGKALDNGEHAPIYYGEIVVAGEDPRQEGDFEFSLNDDGFVYGESIAKNLINPETLGVRVSLKGYSEDVSATGDRRYLDAGDYEALVTKGLSNWSDYSSNYNITAVTQDFKIAPKPLTIAYKGGDTTVYNGVAQSPADGKDYQFIWSELLKVDEKDGFVAGVKVEDSGEYAVQPESFATYEAFKQLSIATPVNETTLDPIGDVRVDENGNVIPYLVKPTLPNGVNINNYAITFEAGEFTITPKDLRITIYRQDRTYDATAQLPLSNKNVEFRFNEEDFSENRPADKNNITAILSLVLPDGVEDAINVGSYKIVARLDADPMFARVTNYNLVVNDDSDSYLYINPRTIKVSYKDVNATYGDITKDYDHTQNLVYDNLVVGEEPIGVGAVLNAPIANDRNYVDAGTYVITPDIANIELLSTNYVFSAEQCVEGQLVIAKKALRVTVEQIGVEARCTDDPCDDVHLEQLTQSDFTYIYTESDFAIGEDETNLIGKLYVTNIQQLIDDYKNIVQRPAVPPLVDVEVETEDGNYEFKVTDGSIIIVPTKSKYNLTYLQGLKDAGSLITSGSFVYNGNMRTMETSGLVIGDLEDLLAPEKIRENGDGGKLSLRFVYTKTIDANGNAVIGSVPVVSISDAGTYAVTGYFQNEDPAYKNVTITLEATIVITARPVNYVIDGGLLEQIYGEADKHLHGKAEAVEGEEESGLILGQELGVSITIPTNDNVYRPLGNYAITALYTNTNYAVTFKVRNANGDLINLYGAVEDGVDENQYYVVNPRPIEISLGYQTQVYNGSVAPVIDSASFQDVGAFKILPDESADIVISIVAEDQVALYEVGSYDLVAVALNGNYALTIASYNVIEITAASLKVEAEIASQTYIGTAVEIVLNDETVTGIKSGDALGSNVNLTYAVDGEAINVGDYAVSVAVDNKNYVVTEFVTNGLTITKRSLTITLEAQSSDYDGNIVKPNGEKYTQEGLADGETLIVNIKMVDANGAEISIRDAGDYILTAGYSVSNGIGNTTANYEVTVEDNIYKVNRIAPVLQVNRLTDDSYGSYVYSALGVVISTPKKKATSNSAGAITYSIYVDGEQPGEYTDGTTAIIVNAGAYKLSVKVAASGNYTEGEQTVDIFIHKATPTIDFSKALARVYTYDGTVQEIIGIEHNNTDGGDIFEVTGNTFQDVPANGLLPVTATLKETANYHAASLTMNITINKATFDMSEYSFSGDVIRYGEKIINGSAKGIPDGMEVAYKLNGVDVQDPENELKFKNAGTYVVEAIYNFSRNNYYLPNELVSSITIVINKVDISVTVVSKSGYYGDRPQYDVEDDVTIYGETAYTDELAVTIELEERDIYPVGTYQVTAKATANDNYKLTVISGTYTIVERNITIVADNKEVEYGLNVPLTYSIYYGHGAEKTQEVAGLIGEDKLNGRLDRVPGTTVGEYAITGEFTNSNYNIEIQDGVYKIIPKNITIVVYDQEGVSASDVNPGAYKVVGGMVRGDDLKIKVSGEVGSEPGTYVLTATYDVENKNYNVNIQEGSFILRLLAQINVNNASLQKLYDGTPYVLDAVATSGAPITYRLNGVDVENSFTEVGLYEVLLTAPVHGDYAAPTPLRITIEIRPQTLSTEVDGMHFIISTPEGFGALDEFRVVKTEDLVLSNDAYTSQINTAYVMYIVVDGVETPVEQYLDGKESKVKVKLTNELVEQGAGAWLTDQNVNALNTSNTLDEDGYIELNAIGGSHVLLVTERASAVPIIIILSVIGVVAVILFFMFLFRKKYIN